MLPYKQGPKTRPRKSAQSLAFWGGEQVEHLDVPGISASGGKKKNGSGQLFLFLSTTLNRSSSGLQELFLDYKSQRQQLRRQLWSAEVAGESERAAALQALWDTGQARGTEAKRRTRWRTVRRGRWGRWNPPLVCYFP